MNSESNSAPPPGYHGCYLRVDLACSSARKMPLQEAVLRRFIGGVGLGTYLMLREEAAFADPLSAEAPLAFVFSPLVGSPLTTSAKFAVVGKSPLTGRINDSLASSGFAVAGKKCGCDALVISGRCERPSVLLIDDGDIRLEPAGELWGLPITKSESKLRGRYGTDFQFAVIGPAGERLVRFATISHDRRHAGRGGSGAVLGAKNIKAVGVRGKQRVAWSDDARLLSLAKSLSARSFGPATAKYRELGTLSNLLVFNRLNVLPTRNFQQGSFPAADNFSVEQLTATRQRTRATCVACTIGCEHIYSFERGSDADSGQVRLEYENVFALGPLCGIEDPDTVLAASRFCDEMGIDTVSAGGTIAFAMECVERRLLDAPWLKFGEGAALQRALEEIASQSGLGALLAQGSRHLADALGQDSIEFAPQVKGLEIPGYDPRALQLTALGFAVGTRGADHNRSGAYEVDFSDRVDRRRVSVADVPLAIETENRSAIMDSLILCKFLRGVFDDFYKEAAEMLGAVTGWDVSPDELLATAARIVHAKKLFNIRAGWQPAEDTLPARFLSSNHQGKMNGQLTGEKLGELVAAYNVARGWSTDGWLGDELLQQAQLEGV